MAIDPTTNTGKLRLAVSDFGDVPILPDIVYTETLNDNNGNMARTRQQLAGYILGSLAHNTHEKLSYMEIWGGEAFKNYLTFLKEVLRNPMYNGSSPIPYSGANSTDAYGNVIANPIIQFQKDYKGSQTPLSESDDLTQIAGGYVDC